MAYLARISGDDIQAPVLDCSAGYNHFTRIDVPDIGVHSKPRGPLTRYLHRLLSKAHEEVCEEPTERVNLLHDGSDDWLTVDVESLLAGDQFSFFVGGYNIEGYTEIKRFLYSKGHIYTDGKLLRRGTRVSDYFGDAEELNLRYVGSPDAEIVKRHDYDVLDERQKRHEAMHEKRITGKLEAAGIDHSVVSDDLMYGRVLLSLDFDCDEVIYPIDIADSLSEDGVECECYYRDHGNYVEDEIEAALAGLAEKGFVREVDGGYVLAAEHRRKQIKDQLEKYFIDLNHLADAADLTDAGIVLALTDETLRAGEVKEYMERKGYETDNIGSRLIALAYDGFLATDDHEEFSIVSGRIRIPDDPRQLRLPFLQQL